MRIAYLEDDPAQAKSLTSWIREAGHNCSHFKEAASFTKELNRETYDLVILDWELPESSGLEVLQWVRGNLEWAPPVLFITQRDSESDVVAALNLGADDYITKPPSRGITLARIEALARRREMAGGQCDQLECGHYLLDRQCGEITMGDGRVALTDKEFRLAWLLFSNPGRLFSRDHMLENVWGHGPGLATRTVDIHISRLRKKLALVPENGWRLKAIYQHGYRLESTEESGTV
ncbi:MAG: response regulator transcription factor [Candidatus Sedimenticola sp. (ex Thyasira tokunagai)]